MILVTRSAKQLALLSLVPCERENVRRPYTLCRARHIGTRTIEATALLQIIPTSKKSDF
jgi:hypothetical protein